MKKITYFLLTFVVAFIALPYVTGWVAESATTEIVSKINAKKDEYGQLEIIDYHRGMRSSTASFEWLPPATVAHLFGDSLEFTCDGSHGLTSYEYVCQAKEGEAYREFVRTYLNGKDPLTIEGIVSAFGKITQTIALEPFELLNPELNERVTVQAANLVFSSNDRFETVQLAGNFEGLSLVGERGRALFGNASVDAKFRFNQHDLAIGEASMKISSIALNSDVDDRLDFDQVSIFTDSRESGENLDIFSLSYRLSAEMMKHQAAEQSSSSDWSELNLEFDLSGINMRGFGEFKRLMKQASQNVSEATKSGQASSDSNANMLSVLPKFESLLTKGVAVESVLSARMDDVQLKLDGRAELLKNLRFGDYLLRKLQPGVLMSKFKAHYVATVPQAVFKSQNNNFTLSSPWYTPSRSRSTSSVQIDGEDIQINGEAITPRQFLRLLFRAK